MQEHTYHTPIQKIELKRLRREGKILDIGGGSEALVSRMEGKRVCAVDINMVKIREGQIYNTPANWVLADGRDLCFKDASFSIVTLWFSLAYIVNAESKCLVMQEVYRVLKQKGVASIMGCFIPHNISALAFNAIFEFPDAYSSRITYRVHGEQKQTLQIIEKFAKQVGLKTEYFEENDYWFHLVCRK
ncbi:class I SAM-dependent methyltransferase [Candidatus Thorarchaeota archaeon]|nr:MAG: class I SAM-dependent methyltransferase [Candidatus Thorarchaeota archaeon]